MRKRNDGGNTPLYGVSLGILALLFATWAVHQERRVDALLSAEAPQSGDTTTGAKER